MSRSRNFQKTRDALKSYECHIRNRQQRRIKPVLNERAYSFKVFVGTECIHSEVCTQESWEDNIPVYRNLYS